MSSKVTHIHSAARDSGGHALVKKFKTRVLESLGDLLDGMFDGADDALFDMSEKAENSIDQGLYFDAMRALRLQRPTITQAFIEQLSQVMVQGVDKSGPAPVHALGLMPDAELEEAVAISNMVAKTTSLLRDDLALLQARVQGLLQVHPGAIARNALSPSGICHSLREAMAATDFEIEIKLLIYKLFERSVLARLGASYRMLHDLLKHEKIESAPLPADAATGAARRHGRGADWSRRMAQVRAEVSPENYFGTDEVLDALDRLHTQAGAADSAPHMDPAEFNHALAQRLQAGQDDSTPRSLQREQREMLGRVTAMLNHLLAQGGENSRAAQLLAQLRVPAMKTALIDPSFFRDADHPARRLVNEIATLGTITRAEDASIYSQAQDLITRLVAEFEQDPGVLETVADEVQRLTAQAAHGQTEAERQAWIKRAKSVAMLEIRQQSLGRELPQSIKPFLLKGWGPLLAYRYLQHGLDSAQWRQAGAVLTRILDAVATPGVQANRETLREEQASLLLLVRNQLRELAMGRARVAGLVEALESGFAQALASQAGAADADTDETLLAQLADWMPDETVFDDEGDHDAVSAAFDLALPETAAPGEPKPEPGADPEPAPSALDAAARQIIEVASQPGAWYQVYTGGERMRWLKIGGHDAARGVVTFTNREGQVVYERDAERFAQDLIAERSKPIYESAEFERKLVEIVSTQRQSKSEQ